MAHHKFIFKYTYKKPKSPWTATVSPPELTPKAPLHEQVKNVSINLAPHARRVNLVLIGLLCLVLLVIPFGKDVVDRFLCHYSSSIQDCSAPANVTTSDIPAGSFVALGTNTFAAQQPTATGQAIATLMPWNGKIYMGYGDYTANTGPIHIMYYDPTTGGMTDSVKPDGTAFTSDTESIYNYRAINGKLYALAEDPRGSQCGFFYAQTTDGIHWQDMKNMQPLPPATAGCPPNTTGNWTDAEHTYDMGTLNGSDLWIAGTALGKVNVNGTLRQGLDGAVWHSTDGGTTWDKVLELEPEDPANPYETNRFYILGTLQGKIYMQSVDSATGVHQPCKAYDGATWSTCPDMLPSGSVGGWAPIVFKGKLVYKLIEKIATSDQVESYDGVQRTDLSKYATDIAVDEQGNVLYAVNDAGIYATTDLQNWTQLHVDNMPTNMRSIAIANNILYVGTANSQLYATSLLPARPPIPALSLDPNTGTAPLDVNASASTTTGGSSTITGYSFDFGDGTTTGPSMSTSATHTYAVPGTYTVKLTVTDSAGLSAATSQSLTIGTAPPVAALSLSPSSCTAACMLTVNASGSTAGTYPIATYTFDFGDGTTVGPQASSTASHMYIGTGTYTVVLTVTDTHGFTNKKAQLVTVHAPASSYTGQYYANTSLSGTPITRNDSSINFNWRTGSPMSGMPADHFSVRWTRVVPLAAGTYKFTTTTDDGVRLYFDNTLLINKWINEGPTTYTAMVSTGAGNHTIRMEYYENTGGAVAQFNYQVVSYASVPYTGQYFANPNLSGTPALTRSDAAINFNWGTGSPGSGLPADNFSVRWTASPYFSAGTYRFQTTDDDGVRLYVDNQLVINEWKGEPPTTYLAYVKLGGGYHTIRMEYYEGSYGATAQLGYYLFDPGNGSYEASYWNNTYLSGNPVLTRTDGAINFNWGTGSPGSGVQVDKFSARWTKIATFTAGNHTFTTTTDDGVRLYIDDQLVINEWKGEAATTYKVTKSLTAGAHKIRMEYFDYSGSAVAKLSYN